MNALPLFLLAVVASLLGIVATERGNDMSGLRWFFTALLLGSGVAAIP